MTITNDRLYHAVHGAVRDHLHKHGLDPDAYWTSDLDWSLDTDSGDLTIHVLPYDTWQRRTVHSNINRYA